MKSASDKELLNQLARDKGEALKVLFDRHYAMLASVGTRILSDPDSGKDVAQRVFISLWDKRRTLNITGDLAGYLRRMAINDALGRQRTDQRRRAIKDGLSLAETSPSTAESELLAEEMREVINGAVRQLPDKTREVFVLSRYENLSYKEIAEALRISSKTVEYHMGKALIELRNALK
jgi:RNA polymerase sigma-70 factor (ECF subfamily)